MIITYDNRLFAVLPQFSEAEVRIRSHKIRDIHSIINVLNKMEKNAVNRLKLAKKILFICLYHCGIGIMHSPILWDFSWKQGSY